LAQIPHRASSKQRCPADEFRFSQPERRRPLAAVAVRVGVLKKDREPSGAQRTHRLPVGFTPAMIRLSA